jgi:transcriptional regulator with XRE-family HTH domain
MDVVQLLGKNIRYYRKLRGMTQEQLALEVEMERSYVSDLERGARNPSVRALGRLGMLGESSAQSQGSMPFRVRRLDLHLRTELPIVLSHG